MKPEFDEVDAYKPTAGYRLLPFRFIGLDDDVVVVNEVGEHEIIHRSDLLALAEHRLAPDNPTYLNLKAKHFILDSSAAGPLAMLATKYRAKKAFLDHFTALHIFVITLRCDTSCQYCQVSRVSANRQKYDMTRETADRSLDLVFRSPAPHIKIEFQGGEPLLNFDLLRYITHGAKRRNETAGKNVTFVVTTNLTLVDDEMLAFLGAEGISVSTSLDGPAFIHNANRRRPGNDAYERTIAGITRARAVLGNDRVAALMTTTRLSLEHPAAIVDEYVRLGFDHIFLRPLSPYGFAARTKGSTGYDTAAFLGFYADALDRIIEINRSGFAITEVYAQIVLKKILTPFATGYVDLQSPAGAGISVAAYNYDGDVYASDEARMLAEMGDTTFRLGNVHRDSYDGLFNGPLLRSLVTASCVESLPGCEQCAFQTYCGADPVENYATQQDIIGHRPTGNYCNRNMTVIKHLLRLYHNNDQFVRRLFWSWATNRQPGNLYPELPG